jgi:hypothetical protein
MTLTVITESFEQLARLQAETLGRPDLRLIVIPHPLAGLEASIASERGQSAGTAILSALQFSGQV